MFQGQAMLSPTELAEFLGVPLHTVYAWRHKGTGPKGCKVGKHVRYRMADVQAWLDVQAEPAR